MAKTLVNLIWHVTTQIENCDHLVLVNKLTNFIKPTLEWIVPITETLLSLYTWNYQILQTLAIHPAYYRPGDYFTYAQSAEEYLSAVFILRLTIS